MVNNIDGISGNRPPVTSTSNKSRPEADVSSSSTASSRTDEVSLTSSAQLLKELSDAVQTSPNSSPQRIEAIRQALADGLYEVNAASIADKLLSLDEQL